MPKKSMTTKKSHVFYVKNRQAEQPLEIVPPNLVIIKEQVSGRYAYSYVIYKGVKRRIQEKCNRKKYPQLAAQMNTFSKKRKKHDDKKQNLTSNNSHAFYVKNRQVGQLIETVPANLVITKEVVRERYKYFYVVYEGKKRRIQTIDNAKKAVQYVQLTAQIKNSTFSKKRKKKEDTNQSHMLPILKEPTPMTQTPPILIPPLIAAPAIVAEKKQEVSDEQNQEPVPVGQVVLNEKKDVNSIPNLDNFYVPFNVSQWGLGLFGGQMQKVLEIEPPSCSLKTPTNKK